MQKKKYFKDDRLEGKLAVKKQDAVLIKLLQNGHPTYGYMYAHGYINYFFFEYFTLYLEVCILEYDTCLLIYDPCHPRKSRKEVKYVALWMTVNEEIMQEKPFMMYLFALFLLKIPPSRALAQLIDSRMEIAPACKPLFIRSMIYYCSYVLSKVLCGGNKTFNSFAKFMRMWSIWYRSSAV